MAAFAATEARAEVECVSSRGEAAQQLSGDYGESIVGRGVVGRVPSPKGWVVAELWVNVETGTWTFGAQNFDGKYCILGFGEGWHGVLPKPDEIKI